MEFMKSKTAANLARSFAGEAQARARYTVYAAQARKEEREYLAQLFERTADNERAHAEEFLEAIGKFSPKPVDNLRIDAGFPYALAGTEQNLLFAAKGEQQEFGEIYPDFAAVAASEGFSDLAVLWRSIAEVEGLHHTVFTDAHRQLTDGSLYKKPKPIVWRCLNCGHVVLANEPWKVCPICGKPIGWVQGDVDERQMPPQK